ncbi:ATP-grasp domain-containing protein [Nonomuraea wenchangensis]|uniref:ATP-grasp domain-containing protein n=1 Tax=Nonomuraea wenchangensis TaxID=568860 RepID=UPI0037A19668
MSKGTWTAVRALIVETGFSRGALAAVRSLAAAGWEVGVGAPTGAGLASSSRFRRRRHLVPAAHEDRDAFLAAVRRAVRDHRYDVVFGAGEAEVLALSLLRDEVGASCRAETVRVDPAISDRAARLLAALGWFGLAQLQFVVPEDGRPRLIDLNGRFYGSMALATAAGANLPAAWAALAVGHDVPPTRARPGVRYHWLEGDLRRAAVERRSGLLPDLAGTLRYAAGAVHSTLSLRDPAPALARIRATAAAHLR